ncbi:hypothetical protein [Eubacterium aggregans]|uniref:hypothetical protein n=1 Tax=Eubacterium aggregans TaxID=81409 RepID=UPI003F3AF622
MLQDYRIFDQCGRYQNTPKGDDHLHQGINSDVCCRNQKFVEVTNDLILFIQN